MSLKFYTSSAKELKVKVRKFWGLFPTFVEITGNNPLNRVNEMFRFLIENNSISSNQFGFKPGDCCINQLLFIIHEIFKSFDDGFEVTGVFLDI